MFPVAAALALPNAILPVALFGAILPIFLNWRYLDAIHFDKHVEDDYLMQAIR